VAAAVHDIEQTSPPADEERLSRALRFLGRVKETAAIPSIFRCLGHGSEAVRGEARNALHAFGWQTVVSVVEGLARRGDPERMGVILDGLNAFEAHPQVVDFLDCLADLLKGELYNRTILLLERKRLGLELEKMAALFREIRSPYQIQKVLGQGLFTASYLARNETSGLEVVVRVLRPEFVNQPRVRAGFLELSNRSVHLVHEKLALTREVWTFPDRHIYFTMRDYVPGVTLQRVLETGRRFEPAPAVRIVREVAEALAPLQRKAACHGGIKPSNIFLCQDDHVVLGDPSPPMEGIVVALNRLSYDYRYAAPEMFQGGGVLGPASDFYALGCVAYELVCGAPPFVSDNFHELAARHLNDPIPPPSQRGSALGRAGDAVILKLLARSPRERWGTHEEVLEALAALEATLKPRGLGEGIGIAPPSHPLLRDASLMNYQGGQSVVNFEQTGACLTSDASLGPPTSPPASPELPPHLPGYEILEKLGSGGMGTVYKAVEVALKRTVALKVLPVGVGASAERLARFRTEARAIASLDHPNIVPIYTLFEDRGLMCIALKYVSGGDLARRIHDFAMRGEQMPLADAAALMATLARAVEHAHQHGVLHRDLKPSNILLTPEGDPMIGDFGLAKQLGDSPDAVELTGLGRILGTPAYMAPEQADTSRGNVGPASDVYALGSLFYEMLTGRRPFTGGSVQELLLRIQSEKPAPPSQLRQEIPRDLDLICQKCLEKDPARRYASAAALAEDLERWMRGEPITNRPMSTWERLAHFLGFRKSGRRLPGDSRGTP
jgi:serine/threonine protein kinase